MQHNSRAMGRSRRDAASAPGPRPAPARAPFPPPVRPFSTPAPARRPLDARAGRAAIDTRSTITECLAMPDRPPYRLHASVMYQLTLTSRQQERRLDEGLRALGLTRITWCILLAVENEGRSQPSDIAEFIGIDRTACSRALRQMEAQGWIARRNGIPDRRTTHVELTETGRALLCGATPVAEENSRHFLAKLAPGEADTLARLLARLREGEKIALGDF